MSGILKDPADDIPSLSMPQMEFETKADIKLEYEGGGNDVLGLPVAKFDQKTTRPASEASEASSTSFAGTSEDELMNSTTKNVQSW